MTTTMQHAEHTHVTLAPDRQAARRARRMVYESCLISKVPSPAVNDAMGVAAELVSDMVAQAGGPVRIEVVVGDDVVLLRVRDAVGHEHVAHVVTTD